MDQAVSPAPRQAFYDAIGAHSLAPLREPLHALVTRVPTTPAVPVLFSLSDRPVQEALGLSREERGSG